MLSRLACSSVCVRGEVRWPLFVGVSLRPRGNDFMSHVTGPFPSQIAYDQQHSPAAAVESRVRQRVRALATDGYICSHIAHVAALQKGKASGRICLCDWAPCAVGEADLAGMAGEHSWRVVVCLGNSWIRPRLPRRRRPFALHLDAFARRARRVLSMAPGGPCHARGQVLFGKIAARTESGCGHVCCFGAAFLCARACGRPWALRGLAASGEGGRGRRARRPDAACELRRRVDVEVVVVVVVVVMVLIAAVVVVVLAVLLLLLLLPLVECLGRAQGYGTDRLRPRGRHQQPPLRVD
jgi:hypothetical protein